jgi:hypothetical protein
MFLLTLPAGELCDRLEPRRILNAGLLMQGFSSALLFALTIPRIPGVWPWYAVVMLSGAARGLSEPAGQALLPFLVPTERLPVAIARSASVREIAVIAGPAVGGLLAARMPAAVYAVCAIAFLGAALGVAALRGRRGQACSAATLRASIRRVRDGLRFVRSQPIVFGALSLDLCAVLLGGATALLPAYARDILHAGPIGLGLLRSAPAIGGCAMALYQTRHPIRRHFGPKKWRRNYLQLEGTMV